MSEPRCPACGLPLGFTPWPDPGNPSHEICPCCGIQFGYDDWAGGSEVERARAHARWRADWRAGGMKWWSRGQPPPAGWDAERQLREAGLVGA